MADLPGLPALDADSLDAFTAACAARDLAEERRLAYVAATRAAFWLGCSGYWWGDGDRRRSARRCSSPRSARVRGRRGDVRSGRTGRPRTRRTRCWPRSTRRTGRHAGRPALRGGREAAGLVEAGRAGSAMPGSSPPEAAAAAASSAAAEPRAELAAWELDAGLLLAERERQRQRGDGPLEVLLPARLSVSALVALARDPDELARQVRRPMPQPPARQARQGTAFHRWLEERFGQQRLIDDDDLFAEEERVTGRDLIELRAQFEAGEWGGRWPREVEVPFDMLIGDRQVRGRIDAVFADADGSFDVVDWKTGQPPRDASRARTRWPSSSPPTGWPGPRWPTSRSTGSAPPSTTSAATRPSAPPTSSTRRAWSP